MVTSATKSSSVALSGLLIVEVGINLFSTKVYPLYIYSNPVYRVLDFMAGMFAAKAYMEGAFEKAKGSKCEFAILLVFVVQYTIAFFKGASPAYFSILFCATLIVFAYGDGVLSRVLSAPVLQGMSKCCFEFYMTHELGLRFFRKHFAHHSMPYFLRIFVVMILGLGVDLIFIMGYKDVSKRVRKSTNG